MRFSFPGMSITEIEIRYAAMRRPQPLISEAFFFFRDSSQIEREIPKEYQSTFFSDSKSDYQRLEHLKSDIVNNGLEVFIVTF